MVQPQGPLLVTRHRGLAPLQPKHIAATHATMFSNDLVRESTARAEVDDVLPGRPKERRGLPRRQQVVAKPRHTVNVGQYPPKTQQAIATLRD
jgi:hypothetical protein